MEKICTGALGTVYLENGKIYKSIPYIEMYEESKKNKLLNDLINRVYPIYGIEDVQFKDNNVIVIKKYIAGDTLDETFKKVQNPKDYLEKWSIYRLKLIKLKLICQENIVTN